MATQNPGFSIVIATFNCAATLKSSIESVLTQVYPHKELVVIDGGSTDGTVDIIRSFDSEISFWLSEPDRGVYQAWNKGVDASQGEWLHFLGADDRLVSPDVLGRVAARLRNCPEEIRLAYGNVLLISHTGQVIATLNEPWGKARRQLRRRLSIQTPGIFFRRSMFRVHGRFDESFRIAADYEFLLRELAVGYPLFLDNIEISYWRLGGLSSDPANGPLLRYEDARARRMNGLFPYPPVWCWELLKSHVMRILHRSMGAHRAVEIRNLYRRITRNPLRSDVDS